MDEEPIRTLRLSPYYPKKGNLEKDNHVTPFFHAALIPLDHRTHVFFRERGALSPLHGAECRDRDANFFNQDVPRRGCCEKDVETWGEDVASNNQGGVLRVEKCRVDLYFICDHGLVCCPNAIFEEFVGESWASWELRQLVTTHFYGVGTLDTPWGRGFAFSCEP